MSRIKNVVPMDEYKLQVFLDNGSSVILNLASRLGTVRFGILVDKKLFKQVTTDGHYLKWDDKLEISVSEIFQLAQK